MESPEKPNHEAAVTPAKPPSRYGALHAQILAFVNEFTQESDRASVILCSAKIDYLCGQILSKFLLPNPGGQDDLLDTDRALGTFGARIHALYRLGIIDAELARALHLLRRLRNSFAHEMSGSTFDHGPHKDRITEFARPFVGHESYNEFRNRISEKRGVAADFYAVTALIVATLERLLHDLIPLSGSHAVSLWPPGWQRQKEQAKT